MPYPILRYTFVEVCPICNGTPQMITPATVNARARFSRCPDCGVLIQTPRMSDKDNYDFYYSGKYRASIKSPPETINRGEQERAERLGQLIREKLGEIATHLDVGCSRGFLLNEVDAKYKTGVEPNLNYFLTSPILEGLTTALYVNLEQVEGKFSLITCIHTLEHVTDPLRMLLEMKGHLTKRGKLVVEVPLGRVALYFPHLFSWDERAFGRMAELAGLKITDTYTQPHLLAFMEIAKHD